MLVDGAHPRKGGFRASLSPGYNRRCSFIALLDCSYPNDVELWRVRPLEGQELPRPIMGVLQKAARVAAAGGRRTAPRGQTNQSWPLAYRK